MLQMWRSYSYQDDSCVICNELREVKVCLRNRKTISSDSTLQCVNCNGSIPQTTKAAREIKKLVEYPDIMKKTAEGPPKPKMTTPAKTATAPAKIKDEILFSLVNQLLANRLK